jgi:F-type H+-transporting ATPase subunit a
LASSFAQIATRKMSEVPGGAQNFLEWLVAGLYGLLEGIIGPHLVKRTFWFFATIFIFILAANWFGLVPGVGTIGWGHEGAHGFKVDQPLLRGANADLNLTSAMSSRSGFTGRFGRSGAAIARVVRAPG